MEERIPFIYPLSSPNGKYIYDVNTNEVISVSDRVYQTLIKILRKEKFELDADVEQEIELIRNMGYLSNKKVEIIEHPSLPYLKTYLDRKVQKVTLQVTQGCNLRCSYCVYSEFGNKKQRSHSSKRMSFDTAKQVIDFLLKHSVDSKRINIGFYGGEPLLEFELIKKTVLYSEGIFEGKELNFSITSNGTLLTDEIIEFFIKHNVDLMMSIDGPPEIHNKSRKFAKDGSGTFETILKNLKRVETKYPDYFKKIGINMVVDPQNDYSCINSVFVDYKIFKEIDMRSTLVDNLYSTEETKFSDKFIEDSNYQIFLAFLSKFNRIDKRDVSPIALQEIERLDTKIEEMDNYKSLPLKAAPGGPCIPGQLRLFVNVDGLFYPCERVSETSNAMQIGNLIDGFDYAKAGNLLNIGSITSNQCRNCWAFYHCTLCGKHADDGDKLSSECKLKYCNSVRQSLISDLQSIILFKEINMIYQ